MGGVSYNFYTPCFLFALVLMFRLLLYFNTLPSHFPPGHFSSAPPAILSTQNIATVIPKFYNHFISPFPSLTYKTYLSEASQPVLKTTPLVLNPQSTNLPNPSPRSTTSNPLPAKALTRFFSTTTSPSCGFTSSQICVSGFPARNSPVLAAESQAAGAEGEISGCPGRKGR